MTEEMKSILGGTAVLFALGMFALEWMGAFSGLALIASSAALLLAYFNIIPWDVLCWAGMAVVGGTALDWSRYSTRMDRAIRRRNEYDRLQAIEQAWWDNNPDPLNQLHQWLATEHGLDYLDIQYPQRTVQGNQAVNVWHSRRGGGRVIVPVVMEDLTGPWTTQPKHKWIRDLRAWEAYKRKHEGDMDALQAYAEGRAR